MNRMEFVGETLRATLEALAVAAPAWLSGLVTTEWADRYGRCVDGNRFPKEEDAREQWSGRPPSGHGDSTRTHWVDDATTASATRAPTPSTQRGTDEVGTH
ncbi:hypothetical protein [Streptomyces albipurpureus]|uniref:Uncharacterized protein n=1 Tax=Streptomyces albipurpureus TaxID=2897419 RepID=A0ABT0ULK3_9ACTN|nr:hypothetical protein [Streptomyces sp. CWNU-1]MCM2388283.1 hypothetical protein [Streptomyces sp. CWNU-1]